MKSLVPIFQSLAVAAGLAAAWSADLATAADAPAPAEAPEVAALRREFEKRTSDALRPVYTWYEGELGRLERNFTVRGNLDGAITVREEREQFRVTQALATSGGLRVALEDTRWKFGGDENTQITFKKDGFIECAPWARAGWSFHWQVSGPNTVTFVVVRGPSLIGKQGTLTFAPDLKSFEGISTDGSRVAPSPRVK